MTGEAIGQSIRIHASKLVHLEIAASSRAKFPIAPLIGTRTGSLYAPISDMRHLTTVFNTVGVKFESCMAIYFRGSPFGREYDEHKWGNYSQFYLSNKRRWESEIASADTHVCIVELA
jgi:hypothetical protein